MLTGLKNKRLSDASLFIDDGTTEDRMVTLTIVATGELAPPEKIQMVSGFPEAVFGTPIMVSGYTDAELMMGVSISLQEKKLSQAC